MLALQAVGIWTHCKEEISSFQRESLELQFFANGTQKSIFDTSKQLFLIFYLLEFFTLMSEHSNQSRGNSSPDYSKQFCL